LRIENIEICLWEYQITIEKSFSLIYHAMETNLTNTLFKNTLNSITIWFQLTEKTVFESIDWWCHWDFERLWWTIIENKDAEKDIERMLEEKSTSQSFFSFFFFFVFILSGLLTLHQHLFVWASRFYCFFFFYVSFSHFSLCAQY
jgi:hypothetical protein